MLLEDEALWSCPILGLTHNLLMCLEKYSYATIAVHALSCTSIAINPVILSDEDE